MALCFLSTMMRTPVDACNVVKHISNACNAVQNDADLSTQSRKSHQALREVYLAGLMQQHTFADTIKTCCFMIIFVPYGSDG